MVSSSYTAKKKILIAILNWGLGHATRCMPIINQYISNQYDVFLASDGLALTLLQQEFPQLQTFELPAYAIRYPKKNMIWNMSVQLPHILKTIYQEHRAITQLAQQLQVDIILSDNRFGCYTTKTHNIFMTHQLSLIIPAGRFIQYIIRWCNQQWIKRYFDECWIPDIAVLPNYAGLLSQPTIKGLNLKYIGILSRLKKQKLPIKYDVITILSGPEPQRTYFEQAILKQASSLKQYTFLIITGNTFNTSSAALHITIKGLTTTPALQTYINQSKIVLCRSGYTSLMDLIQLEKPAILVPTPGQTEQEYLAQYFAEKKNYCVQAQDEFDLEKGIGFYYNILF